MVGRWIENKSVLPAIEEGVPAFALGGHLVARAFDVKRHEWMKLLPEVVVQVCVFPRLVRQDKYLANDIFALGGQ